MVELSSLLNMRLSELLVSLNPATSGFVVVSCMYSEALGTEISVESSSASIQDHIHRIIECERRGIKGRLHVIRTILRRHDVWERAMLHAAEGVAAGDESDHFGLIETHARKCGGMRIKTLEGLGNS